MKVVMSFEKKHVYFLLFGIAVIVLVSAGFAYDSTFAGDETQPPVFGHSADEINVLVDDTDADNIKNNLYTLQAAINGGFIGGGTPQGEPPVESFWQVAGGGIHYGPGNVRIDSGTLDLGSAGAGAQINIGTGADLIFDLISASGGQGSDFIFRQAGTSTSDIFTIDGDTGNVVMSGSLDMKNLNILAAGDSSDDITFNLFDDSGADFLFQQAGVDIFYIDGDSGSISMPGSITLDNRLNIETTGSDAIFNILDSDGGGGTDFIFKDLNGANVLTIDGNGGKLVTFDSSLAFAGTGNYLRLPRGGGSSTPMAACDDTTTGYVYFDVNEGGDSFPCVCVEIGGYRWVKMAEYGGDEECSPTA